MLEITKLTLKAGNFSIKEISIFVPENTIHVILGPSGSGKTLLLEEIAGFSTGTQSTYYLSGSIKLNGLDITHFQPEQRKFSYVPQDLALFPHLNVEDNIFFGYEMQHPSERKVSREFALTLADNVGVRSLLKRSINSLSGGEQQRVALVRAMASGNRHLLLDEPFNGLHSGMKKELWFLLKEIQVKHNLTIIMITHDLEEAFLLGDSISVLIDGTVVQSEPKQNARTPKTLAVAKLYGIKNIFDARIKKNNNSYDIYIPDLGLTLKEKHLPAGFDCLSLGDNILKIGIRPEDIILYDPEKLEGIRAVTPEVLYLPMLTGTIASYFEKDHGAIILFKPYDKKILVEAELAFHKARKLCIKPNKPIALVIPLEHIFPIFKYEP